MYERNRVPRRAALGGAAIAAVVAASASALVELPPGIQVNNDPAAGINPALSVSGADPANADVTGGSLIAGNKAVPWAVFRQEESSASPPTRPDQIFSRSFAGGSWTTRGIGVVGGLTSAGRLSGSLNFNPNRDGEAPAIDFAGTGRTVPWATWYERTTGTGFGNHDNVLASRFDNTGDANQGKWIFGGQGRGTGGASSNVPVPALNIHTNRDAENPSVAGGSAVDPTKPGPWVTWQETTTAPVSGTDEIFVSRPIGPGTANCDGVTPAGVPDGTGHVPAVGGFCWQQTGIGRAVGGTNDPTLNVDPTRNGIEPDIAFTGLGDSVPWVVWYETGPTTLTGLHTNEMVFAAKGVSDATADGGFHWVAVGNGLQGTLDRTHLNHFGACAAAGVNEGHCSLNHDPAADAEDPRVAAGTMDPATPTVPWVVWDENVAGVRQVFVSRLVGTGTAARFRIVNGGAPITTGTSDATRPDITFSGNTPYVTWRRNVGGGADDNFVGHFTNATNPQFIVDGHFPTLTPTAQADVRQPISSGCTANPFNSDGAACQGGALGTPFFLATTGTSPRKLIAVGFDPANPTTGGATGITPSGATVAGSINPVGAIVSVSFQFGTTTAYGSSTTSQKTPLDHRVHSFSAAVSGMPANTTIHYRAIAQSDFGTFFGADQTFKTAS